MPDIHSTLVPKDSQFVYWARPLYKHRAKQVDLYSNLVSLAFLVSSTTSFWFFTGTPFLGVGSWKYKLFVFPMLTILMKLATRPLSRKTLLVPRVCELETPLPLSKVGFIYELVSDLPRRIFSGLVAGFAGFFLSNPSILWIKTDWAQDEGYPRLSSSLIDLVCFLVTFSFMYSLRRMLNNHDYISFKNQGHNVSALKALAHSLMKGCRSYYISLLNVSLGLIFSRVFASFFFNSLAKFWNLFQDTLVAPSLFRVELWPRFPIQILIIGLLIDLFWGTLGNLVSIILSEPVPIKEVLKVDPKLIVSGLSVSSLHDDYIRTLCANVLEISVKQPKFRANIFGGVDSESHISSKCWIVVRDSLVKAIKETRQCLDSYVTKNDKLEKSNFSDRPNSLQIFVSSHLSNLEASLKNHSKLYFPAAYAILSPKHPQVQLQAISNTYNIGFKCASAISQLVVHAQDEDQLGIVQFDVKDIKNDLKALHSTTLNLLARIDSLPYSLPPLWGRQDIYEASVHLKDSVELISRLYDENSLSSSI